MSQVLKSSLPGILVALVVIVGAMAIGIPTANSQLPDIGGTETASPTATPTETTSPTPTETETTSPNPFPFPTELPGDDEEATSGRLGGATRFETSVQISQFQFSEGADRVYLARADVFADALSAGSLTDGPILLVPSCGDIPDVVTDEITRLQPNQVIALGGTAAVCDQVLQEATAAANEDGTSGEPTPEPTATETTSPEPTETETEGGGLPLPGSDPTPTESPTATESPTPTTTTASS